MSLGLAAVAVIATVTTVTAVATASAAVATATLTASAGRSLGVRGEAGVRGEVLLAVLLTVADPNLDTKAADLRVRDSERVVDVSTESMERGTTAVAVVVIVASVDKTVIPRLVRGILFTNESPAPAGLY